MKFAICINDEDSYGDLTKGRVYEVLHACPNLVKITDNSQRVSRWFSHRFVVLPSHRTWLYEFLKEAEF